MSFRDLINKVWPKQSQPLEQVKQAQTILDTIAADAQSIRMTVESSHRTLKQLARDMHEGHRTKRKKPTRAPRSSKAATRRRAK